MQTHCCLAHHKPTLTNCRGFKTPWSSYSISATLAHQTHSKPCTGSLLGSASTLNSPRTFKLLQHSSPAYLASLIQPYLVHCAHTDRNSWRSHMSELAYWLQSIQCCCAPKFWNFLPLLNQALPFSRILQACPQTPFHHHSELAPCKRRAPPIRFSARSVRALIDCARYVHILLL